MPATSARTHTVAKRARAAASEALYPLGQHAGNSKIQEKSMREATRAAVPPEPPVRMPRPRRTSDRKSRLASTVGRRLAGSTAAWGGLPVGIPPKNTSDVRKAHSRYFLGQACIEFRVSHISKTFFFVSYLSRRPRRTRPAVGPEEARRARAVRLARARREGRDTWAREVRAKTFEVGGQDKLTVDRTHAKSIGQGLLARSCAPNRSQHALHLSRPRPAALLTARTTSIGSRVSGEKDSESDTGESSESESDNGESSESDTCNEAARGFQRPQ